MEILNTADQFLQGKMEQYDASAYIHIIDDKFDEPSLELDEEVQEAASDLGRHILFHGLGGHDYSEDIIKSRAELAELLGKK